MSALLFNQEHYKNKGAASELDVFGWDGASMGRGTGSHFKIYFKIRF